MNNMDLDVDAMNKIIKKVIGEIGSSRDQILDIVDNVRKDYEDLKFQLEQVRQESARIIAEVDELEKQDRAGRVRLAEVSANFNKYTEFDIKAAYEKASKIMFEFYKKKNEEKSLRLQRDSLEIALKKAMANIESGEKIME